MTDIPRYLVAGTKCMYIGISMHILRVIEWSSLIDVGIKKIHLIIFKGDEGYNSLNDTFISKIKDLAIKKGKKKLVVHFVGFDENPLLGVKDLKSYKEKELSIKAGKTIYCFKDNSLTVSKENGYIAYYPYKDRIFEVEKIYTRNKKFVLYDRVIKKIYDGSWSLINGNLYTNGVEVKAEELDNYVMIVCSKGRK